MCTCLSGKRISCATSRAMLAAAVAAGLGVLGVAQSASAAAMIGIDVGSDREGTGMGSTDTAGVISQQNWNNAPLMGNTSNITGPVAGAIVDNSGAVVSDVTVAWFGDKGNRTWSTGTGFTGGDAKMMAGYLDTGWPSYDATNESVSVSGLPSAFMAGYDIYVYLRGGGTVQLNATSGTSTPLYNFTTMSSPSSYIQATGAGGAADYAVFSGQTASSFKVSSFGGYIAGVQIVEAIPEPASLSLLGAGSLLLLVRRRAGNA